MNDIGTVAPETHLKGDVFDLYEKAIQAGTGEWAAISQLQRSEWTWKLSKKRPCSQPNCRMKDFQSEVYDGAHSK